MPTSPLYFRGVTCCGPTATWAHALPPWPLICTRNAAWPPVTEWPSTPPMRPSTWRPCTPSCGPGPCRCRSTTSCMPKNWPTCWPTPARVWCWHRRRWHRPRARPGRRMPVCWFTDVDDVLPGDAMVYAAPLSHGAGLYNYAQVLRGGRHVVPLSGGFESAELVQLAASVGQLTLFAAPTMVHRPVDP